MSSRDTAGPRPMGGPMRGMMGQPPAKARDARLTMRRLLGELRPERTRLTAILSLVTASVVLGVFGPKILGEATNKVFYGFIGSRLPPGLTRDQAVAMLRTRGQDRVADMLAASDVVPGQGVDFDAVRRLLIIVIALYMASALFMWLQGYLLAGVTQRTMYRLRQQSEEKLGRLPLSYFDGQSRGDLLSRVTNDVDNISSSMQQSLSQILNSVLTVVAVLSMMLWISPLLAIVALIAVPLSMVASVRIAKRSQVDFATQWTWTGKLNGHVEEMHTGHSLVRVFGRRQAALSQFDDINERLVDASFRAQFLSSLIQPITMFINNLTYVAIAVLGGYRVATGAMTLGDVQAFIQYSRQFSMPLAQIAGLMSLVQSGTASAERVFELLDAQEEVPDSQQPQLLERAAGAVRFEGVSFGYRPDAPLMTDFNLDVRPGQTVAIVGPTGAGKTTLVNLLMRFYEIDQGRITVDGIDIRELTRDNLRSQFGMVLQDAWLFTGTVRENIEYGTDSPSPGDAEAAARAASADHLVRSLPHGYETTLTDDLASVSAGERQLLTIARAFIADPPILILDEATSSVDTRTERLVQQAMAELRKGRTAFVIAHRLSTIRDADTILVMEHGSIVERGNHESLMAAKGPYHRLYTSQFAGGSEPTHAV